MHSGLKSEKKFNLVELYMFASSANVDFFEKKNQMEQSWRGLQSEEIFSKHVDFLALDVIMQTSHIRNFLSTIFQFITHCNESKNHLLTIY